MTGPRRIVHRNRMGCLGDVTRAKDRRRRRRRRRHRRRKLSTRVPGSDDRVAAGNLSESSKFPLSELPLEDFI